MKLISIYPGWGIIFAEKADRQMTGNLTRMFLDMEYTCDRWQENESVQAEQASILKIMELDGKGKNM